jgi:hypothetical protein
MAIATAPAPRRIRDLLCDLAHDRGSGKYEHHEYEAEMRAVPYW